MVRNHGPLAGTLRHGRESDEHDSSVCNWAKLSLPVRGVAQATRPRARLQCASTPDVPLCAATRVATTVVLSRCSASGRVCLIADSRAVGATYSIGCRARFCVLSSRGRRPPCLLRLLRTERHLGGALRASVASPCHRYMAQYIHRVGWKCRFDRDKHDRPRMRRRRQQGAAHLVATVVFLDPNGVVFVLDDDEALGVCPWTAIRGS